MIIVFLLHIHHMYRLQDARHVTSRALVVVVLVILSLQNMSHYCNGDDHLVVLGVFCSKRTVSSSSQEMSRADKKKLDTRCKLFEDNRPFFYEVLQNHHHL